MFCSETSQMKIEENETETKLNGDDLLNPYWMEDKHLRSCDVAYLQPSELQFWNELINKYLYPFENNNDFRARFGSELTKFRNVVLFAYFMINALFLVIVFSLQLNKDKIHVGWNLGFRENITIIAHINESVSLEPIEIIFTIFAIFFGAILVIQFIAMLFYRFEILSHILGKILLSVEFILKRAEL